MNRYDKDAQKTVLTLALEAHRRLMRGQLLGFIFAMTCLLSGVFLISDDQAVAEMPPDGDTISFATLLAHSVSRILVCKMGGVGLSEDVARLRGH